MVSRHIDQGALPAPHRNERVAHLAQVGVHLVQGGALLGGATGAGPIGANGLRAPLPGFEVGVPMTCGAGTEFVGKPLGAGITLPVWSW